MRSSSVRSRRKRQQRRRILYRIGYIAIAVLILAVIITAIVMIVKALKGDDKVANTQPTEEEVFLVDTPEDEPFVKYEASATDATVAVGEEIESPYVVVIDEEAHEIVAEKSAHERMIPASMTKVLTVLTAAQNLTVEDLDTKVVVSLEATDYAYENGCSIAGFYDGEEVTLRDLFCGTILPSGGEAACQLALYTSGSVEEFVNDMNEMCKTLGIDETSHFTNPVGIYDEELYSTAYDMAIIMQAAMDNEICREILSEHSYRTSKTEQNPEGVVISNWFLRRIEDHYDGGIIVGAKTGFVNESRNCAVSYCETNSGKTYICVTAGASSGWNCIFNHVDLYNTYAK